MMLHFRSFGVRTWHCKNYFICNPTQVGYDMTKNAASSLFEKSGYKPDDVDVIELHDCFSANELITYEALGLCPPGQCSSVSRLVRFEL